MIVKFLDFIKTDPLRQGDDMIYRHPVKNKDTQVSYVSWDQNSGMVEIIDKAQMHSQYKISVSDCFVNTDGFFTRKYKLMKFEIFKGKNLITLPTKDGSTSVDVGDLLIILNDKNVYLRDWNIGDKDGNGYKALEVTPEFIRANISNFFEKIG